MAHPAVAREAETRVQPALDYRVGVARNESTVSTVFADAAAFAMALPEARRDELARHLLAIGRDELSPEVERYAAVEALRMLADAIGVEVRAELFEGVIGLAGDRASAHPLDLVTRGMTHPLSRIRIDVSSLRLSWAAIGAASRLATTDAHVAQLLEALQPFAGADDERALVAAAEAVLVLDPAIRPRFDLEDLAGHPAPAVRQLTASLWAEDPETSPWLGLRLAADPAKPVRLRVARATTKVAERVPEVAARLRTLLAADPSAEVRATIGPT